MIAKNQWSSNFTMNEFEKALLQINTYNLPKTKFSEYIIEHVIVKLRRFNMFIFYT